MAKIQANKANTSAEKTSLKKDATSKRKTRRTGKEYVVTGVVHAADGAPAAGLLVQAFDRDVAREQLIGSATTDSLGAYRIRFTEAQYRLTKSERGGPEVFVRVSNSTVQVLAQSKTISNAPHKVQLDVQLPSNAFVVRGRVSDSEGRPGQGYVVRAFDRNVGAEDTLLGQGTTDGQGNYSISYTPDQLGGKSAADLVLGVYRDETLLQEAEVIFDAGLEEIRDLVIGMEGSSEFQRLSGKIHPLLNAGVQLTGLAREHVDFLSRKAGVETRQVERLAQAASLAEATGLPAEVAYGLISQNLPSAPYELLSRKPRTLLQALKTAARQNTIPAQFADDPDVRQQIKDLIVDQAFKESPETVRPSLGNLIATVLPALEQQREFVSLYVDHEGSLDSFFQTQDWQQHPELQSRVEDLRFALETEDLTQNLAFVKMLQQKRGDGEIRNLRDLAKYRLEDWKEMVGKLPEEEISRTPSKSSSASNEAGQLEAYVSQLARSVEDKFPTDVIAYRVIDTHITRSERFNSPGLRVFFQNYLNQKPAFDLRTDLIGKYFRDHSEILADIPPDQYAELKTGLRAMQRIRRLTENAAQMDTLLESGIHSSAQIARMSQATFMCAYSGIEGGETAAAMIYANGQLAAASTLALLVEYHPAFNPFDLPSLTSSTRAAQDVDIPDWESLFGTFDLCDCPQCRTVLSPAAFFTDILHFLKQRAEPGGSGKTALDVLLERRPDLVEIELTCSNTNTALPYVDLVNEILENEVAPRDFTIAFIPAIEMGNPHFIPLKLRRAFELQGYALGPEARLVDPIPGKPNEWRVSDTGWHYRLVSNPSDNTARVYPWPQTGSSREDLAAGPEHIHAKAYEVLRSQVYPWNLPRDEWFEEVRACLEKLGVPRGTLMRAFYRTADDDSALAASPAIAADSLGMPAVEWKITANELEDLNIHLPELWGFAENYFSWVNELKPVRAFLSRSGLSYSELTELLELRYINHWKTFKIDVNDATRMEAENPNNPNPTLLTTCDTSRLEIKNLNESALLKIHGFVRLWRRLGWSMKELDQAICALLPLRVDDAARANMQAASLGIEALFSTAPDELNSFLVSLQPLKEMLDTWADGQKNNPLEIPLEQAAALRSHITALWNASLVISSAHAQVLQLNADAFERAIEYMRILPDTGKCLPEYFAWLVKLQKMIRDLQDEGIIANIPGLKKFLGLSREDAPDVETLMNIRAELQQATLTCMKEITNTNDLKKKAILRDLLDQLQKFSAAAEQLVEPVLRAGIQHFLEGCSRLIRDLLDTRLVTRRRLRDSIQDVRNYLACEYIQHWAEYYPKSEELPRALPDRLETFARNLGAILLSDGLGQEFFDHTTRLEEFLIHLPGQQPSVALVGELIYRVQAPLDFLAQIETWYEQAFTSENTTAPYEADPYLQKLVIALHELETEVGIRFQRKQLNLELHTQLIALQDHIAQASATRLTGSLLKELLDLLRTLERFAGADGATLPQETATIINSTRDLLSTSSFDETLMTQLLDLNRLLLRQIEQELALWPLDILMKENLLLSDLSARQEFGQSTDFHRQLVGLLNWSTTLIGTATLDSSLLVQFSQIQQLKGRFKLPVQYLLAWYAPLGTYQYAGDQPASHYAELFQKSKTGFAAAKWFDLDALGVGLRHSNRFLSEDAISAQLAAAYHASANEIKLLLYGREVQMGQGTVSVVAPAVSFGGWLTLENLARMFRYVSMARALKLPVYDLLRIRALSGVDPFVMFDNSGQTSPGQTARFIETVGQIRTSGFTLDDLEYLLRGLSLSRGTPKPEAAAPILETLRAGLRQIVAGTTSAPDPTGELTRAALVASYDATRVTQVVRWLQWDKTRFDQALLENSSALYDHLLEVGAPAATSTLEVLPPDLEWPDALKQRMLYREQAGELSILGAMTLDEKNGLLALSQDQAYCAAIETLFIYPRRYVVGNLREFVLPTFRSPLPQLPSGLSIPEVLKTRVYHDPAGDGALCCAGIMTAEDRDALLGLVPVVETVADDQKVSWQQYAQALSDLYEQGQQYAQHPEDVTPAPENEFLRVEDGAALFDLAETAAEKRFRLVLERYLRYARVTASEALVTQTFSQALQIDALMMREALANWIQAPGTTDLPAMDVFLLPEFIASDPRVNISVDLFETQFNTFARLQRTALVLNRFGVMPEQMIWLDKYAPQVGWLDLNDLPVVASTTSDDERQTQRFQGWSRLVDLFHLRETLPGGADTLLAVLAGARDASLSKDSEIFLSWLGELTGWNLADVRLLTDSYHLGKEFPGDFQHERLLKQLQTCFALIHTLRVNAAQCWRWVGGDSQTSLLTREDAQIAWQAFQSRFGDQWTEAAKPLADALREGRRSALTACLIARTDLRGQPFWANTNELYSHFLIDVEMTPAVPTSRIKQSCASVQLFVQRCLMNLESAVIANTEMDDGWLQWEAWMKNYRVWEANRKIFLWPENWIEPELRDDKSPFYRDLENELMQNEITDETAELAFRHYLEKLNQVARLEVCGLYKELVDSPGQSVYRLHVIARTSNTPHTYYYRTCQDWTDWTPWEKIDLDIEGDTLLPIVWNKRLYLFWIILKEETKKERLVMKLNAETQEARHLWKAQLAWSCYVNGKWSPRKMTKHSVEIPWPADPQGLGTYSITCTERIPQVDIFCGTCKHEMTFPDCPYKLWMPHPKVMMLEGDAGEDHLSVFIDWIDERYYFPFTGQSYVYYSYRFTNPDSQPEYNFSGGSNRPVNASDNVNDVGNVNVFTIPDSMRIVGKQDVWIQLWDAQNHYMSPYRMLTTPGNNSTEFPPAFALFPVTEFMRGIASPATFFYSDNKRTFLAYLYNDSQYQLRSFYHPFASGFCNMIFRGGLPALLSRQNQLLHTDFSFLTDYQPTDVIDDSSYQYLAEEVDFTSGAYALYNWELFFHIPLLIADRLSKNQRYDEAMRWFHYIFNPTDTNRKPDEEHQQHYWQTKPFYQRLMQGAEGESYYEQKIEELLRGIANGDSELLNAVKKWRDDPFKPHLVARTRTTAYQKTVVMKYIDNLVAWGDQLFRRDTIEAINEATQLYILAAEILGRRPDVIKPRYAPNVHTYNTLPDLRDNDFSDPLVEAENLFAPGGVGYQGSTPAMPVPMLLFFGVPKNDKLLSYWDIVADRLFKIRHGLNIEGVDRPLPLFEPPIDPAMLVRAAAAGVSLSSVLNDAATPTPHYHFNIMSQKSAELCAEVKALGAALLAALEKRDAEAIARLRSSHEISVLEAVREVKQNQYKEANETLGSLHESQKVVQIRYDYYSSRPYFNSLEQAHLGLMGNSIMVQNAQLAADILAAILYLVPDNKLGPPTTIGATYGGSKVAPAVQSFGSGAGVTAAMLSAGASIASTLAGYQRRQEEWQHQAKLARQELKQIEKQIAAADIRLAVADLELKNHDLQTENAKAIDEEMRAKFTNQELYDWMIGQISAVYFQSYQLAYDIAKRAERAFRFELGLEDSNYIQFGYWDSLKKGLLAGDRLYHDLKRMEMAYLEKNKREYEITKHISLLSLNPLALITLKAAGQCEIELPEELFDMDCPGQYMRRIKSVSLTIPCVAGPYTSVNCKLTLLNSKIRKNTSISDGYSQVVDADDQRFISAFGRIQSIVTSSGQNDSGLFELNFRDERYLPFEGSGAISRWRIELPAEFRQFDYNTISDVILHVRYTAREGGDVLKQAANQALVAALAELGKSPQYRLFSLRHEFPTEWSAFVNGTGNFTAAIRKEHFPYFVQGKSINIESLDLYAGEDIARHYAVADPGAVDGQFILDLQPDNPSASNPVLTRNANTEVFLIVRYKCIVVLPS